MAALPGGRDFYAIAHRAGNNLHAVEDALTSGADAIECDFWHANGRLALRHERKLPAIPVFVDKWYLRFGFGELSLRRLLQAINMRTDIYLDIKSKTPRAAEAVIDLYHDHEAMMPPARVSSHEWTLLDRIAEAGTEMRVFYSVGNAARLEALLRRAERDHPPRGASVRHTLLSPERVTELHAAGIEIYAWTVNLEDRARDLLSWGVDGIISDDYAIFERLGNLPPHPDPQQRDGPPPA